MVNFHHIKKHGSWPQILGQFHYIYNNAKRWQNALFQSVQFVTVRKYSDSDSGGLNYTLCDNIQPIWSKSGVWDKTFPFKLKIVSVGWWIINYVIDLTWFIKKKGRFAYLSLSLFFLTLLWYDLTIECWHLLFSYIIIIALQLFFKLQMI